MLGHNIHNTSVSAGPGRDRYSITPPTEPIPGQPVTTGSPQPLLILHQSVLSCSREKGEVITDPKPGTCQSKNPAQTVVLRVSTHTGGRKGFSAGLCKVRQAASGDPGP